MLNRQLCSSDNAKRKEDLLWRIMDVNPGIGYNMEHSYETFRSCLISCQNSGLFGPNELDNLSKFWKFYHGEHQINLLRIGSERTAAYLALPWWKRIFTAP